METQVYKEKLETMLATLTTELEAVGMHDPTNKENWVALAEGVNVSEADPNVVADRAEDWAADHAAVETLEVRYNNLARALEKIEAGTYGVCEISGDPIEPERLEANPAARTCIAHMNDEGQLET